MYLCLCERMLTDMSQPFRGVNWPFSWATKYMKHAVNNYSRTYDMTPGTMITSRRPDSRKRRKSSLVRNEITDSQQGPLLENRRRSKSNNFWVITLNLVYPLKGISDRRTSFNITSFNFRRLFWGFFSSPSVSLWKKNVATGDFKV